MRGKEGKQGEFGHFLGKAASCHAGVQIVAFWALTAPAEVLKDQGISLCQILQRPLHCARPLLLCRTLLELILGCAAKTAPPAQEIFASILRQTPLGAFGAAASSPLEANLRQIHDWLCRGGVCVTPKFWGLQEPLLIPAVPRGSQHHSQPACAARALITGL